jgi:Na+/serine symporter
MLRRFFGKLYVQVLIGVSAGVLLGVFFPALGADLKPIGDTFIKLIKMVFAPIIFAMVVLGIAKMESMKELGRVGVRALIYFEVVSTFALGLGLVVVNVFKPGVGMNVDPATLDTKSISNYTAAASKSGSFVDFLVNMVPSSIVDALARNDILQILVFGIFFGVALSHMGRRAKPVVDVLDAFCNSMFGIVGMIMRLAPLAAFGAMAFTVGKYGLASLTSLGQLMLCMYLTCVVFVFVVLGLIARMSGFSIWKFLRYIKDEIFTVLGTSSSESVVPQLMRPGDSLGRDLQPGWPVHLLHHGRDLHCAGHQHAAVHDRPAGDPGRAHAHQQGLGRCHRLRLHHPGRHPGLYGQYPGGRHGSLAGGGPLHVRGPRHHQHHRQCRGHHGRGALGGCAGPGAHAARAGPGPDGGKPL